MVTVQKVGMVLDIPNANHIEEIVLANGAHVVAPKGYHKIGDLVVFFENCYIPRRSLSFLSDCKALVCGYEAYRVKRKKYLHVISDGFCLKIAKFKRYLKLIYGEGEEIAINTQWLKLRHLTLKAGDDVSWLCGALPVSKRLIGSQVFNFLCHYKKKMGP